MVCKGYNAKMFRLERIFAFLLLGFCIFAVAFYTKFVYTTQRSVRDGVNVRPDERKTEINFLNNDQYSQKDNSFVDGVNSQDENWSFNDEIQPESRKYLVYSCSGRSPCGGWGDRLRGIVSTYVMAVLTNRVFVINMTSPCPLTMWLHPNLIPWTVHIKPESQTDEIFIDVHDNTRFSELLKSVDLSKFFIKDVVRLTPNYDLFSRLKLNPIYQTQLTEMSKPVPGKPVSLFSRIFEDLFAMNHNLEFQVSKFLAGLYEPKRHRTLICAQIRMGRNPSIPRDTEIRTRPSELKALWNFLQEYKNDNRFKIFVTTDSESVRKEAKKLFSSQILDTSGPITHPDYRHGNDSCLGLGKIILDQYLLRFCDTLVISKSLFGVIGAHLRGKTSNLYQFSNGTVDRMALSAYHLFNF
ncbi:uncharacterized protein LOC135463379 [Liolophura sinensis]|uniref:uncharacterized protein LOC135463379 n=1 Tax=Liolophura sinensis TaxID=3198878 RepID=UPI00315882C8